MDNIAAGAYNDSQGNYYNRNVKRRVNSKLNKKKMQSHFVKNLNIKEKMAQSVKCMSVNKYEYDDTKSMSSTHHLDFNTNRPTTANPNLRGYMTQNTFFYKASSRNLPLKSGGTTN